MDEIFGITLETLADITTKQGELRAQHGEQRGREELARYLAERGLTEQAWSSAHNGWWERFRADPTGRLEAQFHQMLSQRSLKAHFADVRDMTQDQVEGVTLDQYAQLAVAMGKPGADAEAVARQHGLPDAAKWMAVNAAWAAKMSQDTSFHLTTQYGTLYQKYAGPAFAEATFEQTAAILAASNQPRDVVDAKPVDHSQPTLLAQLGSASRNERWQAARWLAHQWRRGDPSTQANLACIPVLLEILERHDDDTVSNAEDAVDKLTRDLEQYTDDVKSTMTRCSNRAKEKLATLEAAFAPIRDKAVPERIMLQSRIESYRSLVGTLDNALRQWPAAAPGASASLGAALSSAPSPRSSAGLPKALLAVIAAVVVGGGVVAWRVLGASASSPAASATVTTATSPPPAAVASSAPPPAVVTPPPASTRPAASARPASSAKPKAKHTP